MSKMTGPNSELFNKARDCAQSGRLDEAQQSFERIVSIEPGNAAAHFELGMIAMKRGRHRRAVDAISRAIRLDPGRANYHVALGLAFRGLGDFSAGVRAMRKALELDSKDCFAHLNLGNLCKDQGRSAEAEACYRAAIALDPKLIEARINLGDLHMSQGDYVAAADAYREALRIDAARPTVRFNLARALVSLKAWREAAGIFRGIAADRPDYPGVHNMLGVTLMKLGAIEEALSSFGKAVAGQPDRAAPLVNLGDALAARGDLEGAVARFRKALAVQPDHALAHSNLLLTMNYLPGVTQEQLYAESLRFDEQHARPLMRNRPPFRNARDRHRVLKIGYLSPDFRSHSVAHFTWRLLGVHDRQAVEVYCYAHVMNPDAITAQLRSGADHWRSIVELDDEAVAERIRSDGIDILVDLAGHTSNNRLPVFARKPAPVQVNWLGYPNTTGMRGMDYRLTDAVADPPGEADRLHSEKLIRLEHGFLCYQTDESLPQVSAAPCTRHEGGQVTFGSFNMIRKVTPEVIRTWSGLLASVPGSRLLLKSNALEDGSTKTRLLESFGAHGIGAERLELVNGVPRRRDHLEMYSRVDIGLDPFPYNGTTTTCEALWMGVPVICLRGERHAGRVGASLLQRVGLEDLVADDADAYADLARELAGDAGRLSSLRAGLRERMRRSPLMDVAGFTETLERAYRDMWRAWCDQDLTGQ